MYLTSMATRPGRRPARGWQRPACAGAMLILAVLLSGCEEAPSAMPKGPSPMRVQVVTATAGTSSLQFEMLGRIAAQSPAEVFSHHEGIRVLKVHVDAGQSVTAGQVLVELDGRGLRQERLQAEQAMQRAKASMASAQAQLKTAESRWRTADDEALRYRAVEQTGAVSEIEQRQRQAQRDQAQSDAEAAQQGLVAAQADFAAAQAAVALAALRENESVIRAPFAGVISERHVEVGTVVQASAGPLFRLARADDREFVAAIDASRIDSLQAGQSAGVWVVPAGAQAPVVLKGRVRAVDMVLSEARRRGSVRISFEASDLRVGRVPLLGAPATAVLTAPAQSGIALPEAAVQFDPAPWVYVVEAGNRIAKRRVGLAPDGRTVVAGLKSGDLVVKSAAALLSPGQIIDPAMPVASEAGTVRPAEAGK